MVLCKLQPSHNYVCGQNGAYSILPLLTSTLRVVPRAIPQEVIHYRPRSDVELSLALSELSHIVSYLGISTVAIESELTVAATERLKDSAYQVRSSAAALLTNLCTVIPGLAGTVLASSLTMAKLQVSELIFRETSHSPVDSSNSGDLLSLDDAAVEDKHPDEQQQHISQESMDASAERLQRMLTFHGHTMVISNLLRADQSYHLDYLAP